MFAQQHLAQHRQWQDRHPVLQSTSRQNHGMERLWPEINQRINYPVKRVLVQMEGNDELDMTNSTTKFCVSWVTIHIIKSSVHSFIASWNAHRIPGSRGGVPNTLASSSQTGLLSLLTVPTTSDMIRLCCHNGGSLTAEHSFEIDSHGAYVELKNLRERDFYQHHPNLGDIFSNVLHSDGHLF